ncbi:MAG: class E sortase [Nocardioides sp.]
MARSLGKRKATNSGEGAAASRASSRWAGRLGALLIIAGLGILGYVGWQMWGTTYVAQREQADVVSQVEERWADPDTAAEPVKSKGALVSALIRIPKFGKDYAVPMLEGTTDEVLTGGYGRFLEGARVGELGNFALAAHRITHGEPLRRMPELVAGDKVIVETPKAIYTYVLDTGGDDLTVDFTAGWVLEDLPRNPKGGVQPAQEPGQRLITLTTCAELFHTDDRLIAFGHLESKERRS